MRIAFPGLCPQEAAWKLRATFSYAGPEALHPADLHWTITPALAVPGPSPEARAAASGQRPHQYS